MWKEWIGDEMHMGKTRNWMGYTNTSTEILGRAGSNVGGSNQHCVAVLRLEIVAVSNKRRDVPPGNV